MSKKMFRYCEKCGGPLIERLPSGLWVFVFGWMPTNKRLRELKEKFEEEKINEEEYNKAIEDIERAHQKRKKDEEEGAPIVIKIQGSLKMRCFRITCRLKHPNHWNVFHYFPDGALFQSITNQREGVEKIRIGSPKKSDKKENKE